MSRAENLSGEHWSLLHLLLLLFLILIPSFPCSLLALCHLRSGAAKLKEDKKSPLEEKGKGKKGKAAVPQLNRASSRSPGRGGGAGASPAPPSLSRARSLPTPRGKGASAARGGKGSRGKLALGEPETPSGLDKVDPPPEPAKQVQTKINEIFATKSKPEPVTAPGPVVEATKVEPPVRERKRLKRPILNDNPEAPEVLDVPNMKSTLGAENEDIAASPRDGQVLFVIKPGKVREKRVLKGQQKVAQGKMPSVVERESPISVHVNSEDNGAVNSSTSAPHSPHKPVAQVSPFRSVPQSPCKGSNALSVKDIVHGLADTAACLADGVKSNGELADGDTKDLSESDILTRMIRENLNKAVTGGTPDEMKKSLNDAIKNTFRNRSSNSNSPSRVAVTQSEEKPVKTDKTETNILGEIIVNGNMQNGDKDKDDGAEKENKIELIESSDISDGLISHIVEALRDSGDEKNTQPKNLLSSDVVMEIDTSVKEVKLTSPTTMSAITVLPSTVSMQAPATLMSADGITDLPSDPANPETPITLDQLEQGMVPVQSIQIEQIEADGTTTTNSVEMADVAQAENDINFSVVVMEEEPEKPKLNIDKTKLFSQMNDIFAKDTHNALKHRPVYQKRTRQSPDDIKEGASSPSKKKLKVKEAKMEKVAMIGLKGKSEDGSSSERESAAFDALTAVTAVAAITAVTAVPVVEEKLVEVKQLIMQKDAEMEKEKVVEGEDEKLVEPIQIVEGEANVLVESSKVVEEPDDSKMDEETVPELSNTEEEEVPKEKTEASLPALDVPVVEDTQEEEEEDDEEEVEGEEEVDEDEEEEEDAEEEAEVDLDAPNEEKPGASAASEVDLDEPKEAEESDNTCDITETPVASESPGIPEQNNILPPMQTSGSDLTKSLRQVRLNKKTPARSPPKEKWQPRNLSPELEKEEEEIDDDEDDDEEEIDDDEEEEVGPPDSPNMTNLSSNRAKAPDVFDFTDDEDIPLSNIDLAALSAGGPEGGESSLEMAISSSSPLSHLTPRHSPGKSLRSRLPLDVSPQVLTAMDAVAAVQALQLSPPTSRHSPIPSRHSPIPSRRSPIPSRHSPIQSRHSPPPSRQSPVPSRHSPPPSRHNLPLSRHSPPPSRQELPVVKLNGDVMSDDTDNSVGLKALLSAEKIKSAKRKKRRVPESDEGEHSTSLAFLHLCSRLFLTLPFLIVLTCLFSTAETDDDLDSNKKGARPKRIKNLSGPAPPTSESSTPGPSTGQTRPASAASIASIASASDKKDLEDSKQEDAMDGKQTPDSQKSFDKER